MKDQTSHVKCGAKTKSGSPCQLPPVAGRNRCKYHGGKTPVAGPDHPTWKHGRYSKAIPKGLKSLLEQAASDPDLLNLRDEIAVLQVAIADSLATLENVTSVQVSSLREAAKSVREAEGTDAYDAALASLLTLCESASSASDQWHKIADLAERKARLVSAEHKRSVELEQMIPASRLYALIEFVVQVIRDTVKDRELIVAIGDRLRTVFDQAPDRRIDRTVGG